MIVCRRLGTTLAALAATVVLCACGASDDANPADTNPDVGDASDAADPAFGPPVIEIGTGARRYEPLPPDGVATVPIIEGIQGGFHVWGGFAASGLDPEDVSIEFIIARDGERLGGANYRDSLAERVELDQLEAYGYGGVAVIFNADIDPFDVSGQTLELSLTVRDRLGTTLRDSTSVRVLCCEL